MKTLLPVLAAALLAAGCASSATNTATAEPATKEAMGRVAARSVECDMTATRIKPRECTVTATAMNKDDILENERRSQQVQIDLVKSR